MEVLLLDECRFVDGRFPLDGLGQGSDCTISHGERRRGDFLGRLAWLPRKAYLFISQFHFWFRGGILVEFLISGV